jgi:uncharacterized protein (DUF736 family)
MPCRWSGSSKIFDLLQKPLQRSLRAVEPATPKHPAYKGSVIINGQKFWLSGWKRTGDDGSTYLSLSVDQSDGEAPQARKNDAPF